MNKKTNKNEIVHLKNNSLSKVSSTLALTNKLLQEIENRNALPSNDFRVSIPDINFQKYLTDIEGLVITDNSVKYGDIKHIERIDVGSFYNKCNFIKSLEGIQHFTALIELNCSINRITDLDVSQNTALTHLNCWENELMGLDLSKNTALIELFCGRNQITNLDVSQNTALTFLECGNNQLTDLDVSKNTELTSLWCGDNKLRDLDVSQNTALTVLWCRDNQLTDLDVSKNTALSDLNCSNNIDF